ncbi:MAG: phosphopantetheine-binding protein [Solirubrobacteraceae bacterium]|jgi:acyl carrier protein
MTEQEIIARIQRIFEETFNVSAPAPQSDIIEAELLDSVALVALLFEIELQFGIEIPLESLEIDDFRTIKRIARLIG